MKQLTAITLASLCAMGSVYAQSIERVKMTDNDLNCQQIFNEITQMDGIIAQANQPVAAPAAQPAATDNTGGQVAAGVAGAVAQQAIGQAAARGGFGGFGGFGGSAGGLFGGLINQAAQQQQQAAQQQAAQQAAAQQAAAAQAQQNAALGQQAQGRKDHLTSVFLTKGCKMADIQR